MALTLHDVARLNAFAQAVGKEIGWELEFVQLGNPEFVALQAGMPDGNVVLGPGKLSELADTDIELELKALRLGTKVLVRDDKGIVRSTESSAS